MTKGKLILYMFSLALTITVIAQSCSIPIRKMHDGDYIEIKDLQVTLYSYGIFLLIGIAISVFTLVQVSKINKRLKEMGHSV